MICLILIKLYFVNGMVWYYSQPVDNKEKGVKEMLYPQIINMKVFLCTRSNVLTKLVQRKME